MKGIVIEVMLGSDITATCADAIRMAKKLNCEVWFDFNNVTVKATPTSDAGYLIEQWNKELE